MNGGCKLKLAMAKRIYFKDAVRMYWTVIVAREGDTIHLKYYRSAYGYAFDSREQTLVAEISREYDGVLLSVVEVFQWLAEYYVSVCCMGSRHASPEYLPI